MEYGSSQLLGFCCFLTNPEILGLNDAFKFETMFLRTERLSPDQCVTYKASFIMMVFHSSPKIAPKQSDTF